MEKTYIFDQTIKISCEKFAMDMAKENDVKVLAVKKRLQLMPYVGFVNLFIVRATKDDFDNWITDLM